MIGPPGKGGQKERAGGNCEGAITGPCGEPSVGSPSPPKRGRGVRGEGERRAGAGTRVLNPGGGPPPGSCPPPAPGRYRDGTPPEQTRSLPMPRFSAILPLVMPLAASAAPAPR